MAETLEVLTVTGDPTGTMKSRTAIHVDGDWHLAAFVWVFDRRSRIVLQRRSMDKDVWPGRWDASAAGHVQTGESALYAAQRELAEELGLAILEPSAFVAGPLHHEEHWHANGLVDREHHAVFFVHSDQPLEAYQPGPEVTAIAFVEATDLAAFARGASDALPVVARDSEPSSGTSTRLLQRDDMVVYTPAYLERIAAFVLSNARNGA